MAMAASCPTSMAAPSPCKTFPATTGSLATPPGTRATLRFPATGKAEFSPRILVKTRPRPLKCRMVLGENVTESASTELPENLQRIIKSFQSVPDPRARYQQLLFYASRLKPLAKEFQTPENKVSGCVSQVWVLPTLRDDGRVYFEAESDSALTKGLAALLVEGLSGSTPAQILNISPDFILSLGLNQSLTPSRNNGFLNMFYLMKKKTLELEMKRQVETSAPSEESEVDSRESETGNIASVPASSERPIYDSIVSKLSAALSPVEIEVEDVSYQHKGHSGVGSDATETHFVVRVVSEAFQGLSTIKRHRLIYTSLNDEFKKGLHALSIVAKTPSEVQKQSFSS